MSTNLWWIDDQGRNNLEVVPPNNDPILPDDILFLFLSTIPDARASLTDLFPFMTAAGQARVSSFLLANPSAMIQEPDPVTFSDTEQHRWNTQMIVDPNRWR